VCNLFLQILDDGRLTDSRGVKVDFRNTIIIMTSNVGASEFAAEDAEGPTTEAVRARVTAVMQQTFPPEFLNRIDEVPDQPACAHARGAGVAHAAGLAAMAAMAAMAAAAAAAPQVVMFNRLGERNMRAIVDVRLREMEQRLSSHTLTLTVPDDVRNWLAVVRTPSRARGAGRALTGASAVVCDPSQAGADPVYGARPLNRLLNRELLNPLARSLIEGGIQDGDEVRGALWHGRRVRPRGWGG